VRSLGFGARIVSGYLYNPDQQSVGLSDAGSTHAWAEVFVPGAGWITFDPTNRGVGGFNLIPVAVVRDIQQAIPVSGSFVGMTDAFAGMSVEVLVNGDPELREEIAKSLFAVYLNRAYTMRARSSMQKHGSSGFVFHHRNVFSHRAW
jgi:hypothetical protein